MPPFIFSSNYFVPLTHLGFNTSKSIEQSPFNIMISIYFASHFYSKSPMTYKTPNEIGSLTTPSHVIDDGF
jgi:hypothetical protein